MTGLLQVLRPALAYSVGAAVLVVSAFPQMIPGQAGFGRQRISLNSDWKFQKGDPNGDSTGLAYDVRPEVQDEKAVTPADAEPTAAVKVAAAQSVLKLRILPTGNDFIKDPQFGDGRRGQQPGRIFVSGDTGAQQPGA